jgi:hypothetical protein
LLQKILPDVAEDDKAVARLGAGIFLWSGLAFFLCSGQICDSNYPSLCVGLGATPMLVGFAVFMVAVDGNYWLVMPLAKHMEYNELPVEAAPLMLRVESMLPNVTWEAEVIGPDPFLLLSAHDPDTGEQIEREPILCWGPDGTRILPPHYRPPPST